MRQLEEFVVMLTRQPVLLRQLASLDLKLLQQQRSYQQAAAGGDGAAPEADSSGPPSSQRRQQLPPAASTELPIDIIDDSAEGGDGGGGGGGDNLGVLFGCVTCGVSLPDGFGDLALSASCGTATADCDDGVGEWSAGCARGSSGGAAAASGGGGGMMVAIDLMLDYDTDADDNNIAKTKGPSRRGVDADADAEASLAAAEADVAAEADDAFLAASPSGASVPAPPQLQPDASNDAADTARAAAASRRRRLPAAGNGGGDARPHCAMLWHACAEARWNEVRAPWMTGGRMRQTTPGESIDDSIDQTLSRLFVPLCDASSSTTLASVSVLSLTRASVSVGGSRRWWCEHGS